MPINTPTRISYYSRLPFFPPPRDDREPNSASRGQQRTQTEADLRLVADSPTYSYPEIREKVGSLIVYFVVNIYIIIMSKKYNKFHGNKSIL